MVNITRRGSFGLGLGAAGFSLTMVSADMEAVAAPQNTAFSLLLVNDIYRMSDDKGRGGFPKLAAVVKQERARGIPMLFCHAGDTFSPSIMSGFDQGAHIVELTNLIKPDVFVPGNHEWDFGTANYLQRMKDSNFPYYGANVRRADGSPVPGMKDSSVVTLGPLKVGIVGLALASTPHISHSEDWQFLPELDTLRDQVKLVKQQGAEFVLCVAHTDRDMDNAIVRSGLVDVLLSGHDHDLAIGFDGKTVMVESNEEGNFVTSVDFVVNVSGEGKDRKVTWAPSFRVHDSSVVDPDPEVGTAVQRYEADLSKELDVQIGTAKNEMDSRTSQVRSMETNMGDLVADAIKDSTGADLAITNGGGIRANKIYPAGTVLTRRDIFSELPFGNTTSLVEVSGKEVKDALENGVSQIDVKAGRFPQVSGLTFTVDVKAAVGSRISDIKVNGAPLDPAKRYTVATNNFMLAGGDGYTAFTGGKVLIGQTDGKLLANDVMIYVRKLGTVDLKPDGRIAMK